MTSATTNLLFCKFDSIIIAGVVLAVLVIAWLIGAIKGQRATIQVLETEVARLRKAPPIGDVDEDEDEDDDDFPSPVSLFNWYSHARLTAAAGKVVEHPGENLSTLDFAARSAALAIGHQHGKPSADVPMLTAAAVDAEVRRLLSVEPTVADDALRTGERRRVEPEQVDNLEAEAEAVAEEKARAGDKGSLPYRAFKSAS